MEVGKVKIAEDSDFDMLKTLIDVDNGWKLDFDKGTVKVSLRAYCNDNIISAVWSNAQNSSATDPPLAAHLPNPL